LRGLAYLRKFVARNNVVPESSFAQQCCAQVYCVYCPVLATLLRASLLRVLHCGMAMLRCGIGAARPRERTTEKKMKIEIDALGENDEEIERLGERRR
jgi:hypothetical protein